MSFTLDQNVSGAAAAPQPVQQVSNTSIAAGVLGNLMDLGSTAMRVQGSAPKATQEDRDRTIWNVKYRELQADKAAGMSSDEITQKYGPIFAPLGVNAEQKSLLAKEGLQFVVPKAAPSEFDLKVELFSQTDLVTQIGRVQQEREKAEAAGQTISDEVAAQRAVERYAAFQVAANAGIAQGNVDWIEGYDQNIKTLDSFTSAVSAALRVEQRGDNFSLENLQQLRDGFLLLKSQPSFQKPVGKEALEKWEIMSSRLQAVENTFEALAEYDAKNATEEATRLMAQITLQGESPLAALALKDPSGMSQIVAQGTLDLKVAVATMGEIEEVDYKTLNFDPVVLELMGVAPSGAALAETGTNDLPTAEVVFPPEFSETYNKMNLVRRARSLSYHSGVVESVPASSLSTPEGANAFASSVASLSFALTQNEIVSQKYVDSLFSAATLSKINSLSAQGGEGGRIAANLRAQMGLALQHNQALFGRVAAGRVQTIPGIGIDQTTGEFTLTNTTDPMFQSLAAVASKYYNGSFEAMWKEGASARTLLKNRLARAGEIEFDKPSYSNFEAATEVLNSALWKGMATQYNNVKGIPQRLKFFKEMAAKIKVDIGPNALDETTTAPASSEPQTSPRAEQGTFDNPWSISNEEAYSMVPVGAHYIASGDPTKTVRIKGE